jgi:hypothetical protein
VACGVVALAVFAGSGCTTVPTSGAVRAGPPVAQGEGPNVGLKAQPPVPGESAQQIVSGFRYANSDFEGGQGVARQYLANPDWQPDNGVQVIEPDNTPTVSAKGNNLLVHYADSQVGVITPDGTFQPNPSPSPITHDYELTKDSKDKGQWRILNPPKFLVLSVAQVNSSYQKKNVYFLRPDGHMLVPIRVYLPVPSVRLAETLLGTLLKGPPAWLNPAVTTALPPRVTLLEAPTASNGITTVNLSRDVANLSQALRDELAAQIIYTLQDYGPIRILVAGAPLVNGPRIAAVQTTQTWSAFDADATPVDSFYYSGVDHKIHDDRSQVVLGDTGSGGLIQLIAPVVAPRVTVGGAADLIAGIASSSSGFALYAGPFRSPRVLLYGAAFTTPSWDSLGNVWTVQRQDSSSPQQVRVALSAPTTSTTTTTVALPASSVAAPQLANYVIESLHVSRDGTRVAVVAKSTVGTQVLVGVVARAGDSIKLQNFYPVAPSLTSVTDCVWASSNTLDVLVSSIGANGPTAASQLWSVDVDGWPSSQRELFVLSNAQSIAAAPGKPLVVGTASNQIEVFDHETWREVGLGTNPSYPG